MRIPSTIVGIVVAAMLLAVLGLTRLLTPGGQLPEIEVREIEITAMPDPPPPPPEDEPPPDAPPPPPSLTEISDVPDPTRVPVPKADVPMDLSTPVDPFFTDIAPAPLPQPVVAKARPKVETRRPAKPTPAKRPPAPSRKSHYSVGELDSKPRLIRHGPATFPSSLARKGVTSGTVMFEVELNERGSVSIRRVISSSHPEIVAPARRVALGSRYTAPTRHGQPVKLIMRLPVTIKK
ncbi:energy transducer TonB [Luteolibacter marinus]|uniref:energy transducer TonB n=1 Tax=Luteolibacter marinus TaxID=2776705 RepID=UPI001866B953|nr:energy transducer TonB [Luteolibacter marinus]